MRRGSYSTEDFVARLRRGWEMECRVAALLRSWGHDVPDPEWWVRNEDDHAATARAAREQKDIEVGGLILEVKSRDLAFGVSGSYAYPYPTVFLETVAGYAAKDRKPDLYVLVSQRTGGIMAADARSGPGGMLVVDRPDRARQLTEKAYAIPREKLRPHTWLEGFLAAHALTTTGTPGVPERGIMTQRGQL